MKLFALALTLAAAVMGAGMAADAMPTNCLALWLDASQLTGLSDGDPVTVWYDASGNGADAWVPSGNATLTYVADAGTGTGLVAIRERKDRMRQKFDTQM